MTNRAASELDLCAEWIFPSVGSDRLPLPPDQTPRAAAIVRYHMKILPLVLVEVLAVCAIAAESAPAAGSPPVIATQKSAFAPPMAGWSYEEVRRFKAPEAGQGVAVDRDFFYAINNHTIGKYLKDTGERVALWEGGNGGEIIHLNAGIIFDGRLHGVHSNYPGVPMLSSLELFDVATLKPIGSHSFGRMDGSFTWLDRRDNRWIACFVHYGNKGAEPNRDSAWTQIIEFDDQWRRTAGWALPPDLIERFGGRGYSASGGAFGPGGHLYLTGHDNTEIYVVDFPKAGSTMKWIATIAFPSEGQAFCWDPANAGVLYSVLKRTKEVIVGRVRIP